MGAASSTTQATAWRAGWAMALIVPAVPLASLALADSLGSAIWYLTPVVAFILIPLADGLVGTDRRNPDPETIPELAGSGYFQALVVGALGLQLVSLLAASAWLGSGGLPGPAALVGLTLSLGIIAGIGINTGHELGHKPDGWHRWLARLALAQSVYGHFLVEHNRGHHVRVATAADPASARFGESVYRFWLRSIVDGARSAWRIECRRLAARGRGPWTPANVILQGLALSIALCALCLALGGALMAVVFPVQALLGVLLLETVNYLEHYALARQRDPAGRLERVAPRHSWNSNHWVSNRMLFNLPRHADHHAHPNRPYQTLRHFEDSPQLPAGYATMILLAWLPPLWRAVMDRRVAAHYEGDLARANHGPARDLG